MHVYENTFLYICICIMGRPVSTVHDTTVTSVNIFKDKYAIFKVQAEPTNMTLQKLVNRSMYLYITDVKYRQKLDSMFEMALSGSSY